MAQTLLQVQEQIAKLKEKEAKLKKVEAMEVIAKMKVAIEFYGFTPADLFDVSHSSAGTVAPPSAAVKKVSTTGKVSQRTRYADGAGNEWSGMGPRPRWLLEALSKGASLADLALGNRKQKPATSKSTGATTQKKPVAIKYRDTVGNTWTGRGMQPRWLRAAMVAGKKPTDFLV